MGEVDGLKVGDEVGEDGWTVAHAAPAKSVETPGAGVSAIVATAPYIEAHKRVNDSLQVIGADSKEQLEERIAGWQGHQPHPDPNTPDGNREMTSDERMESAKATMSQQVTYGARPSGEVNLTPVGDKPEEASASISVPPVVEIEEYDESKSSTAETNAQARKAEAKK